MRKRRGTQSRSGDYSQVLSQSYSASRSTSSPQTKSLQLECEQQKTYPQFRIYRSFSRVSL